MPIPNELTAIEKPALPVAHAAPSIGDMLQAVIEKGISAENVAAVAEITRLYERMQAIDAEKAFATAFVELQRDIPRIKATKIIPDRNGNMRSSYAPLEEIDKQARPICLQHGFTYTFSEGEFAPQKVTKVCTLQHTGGHKRSNSYSVRIGSGPPGCSESQADGSAHSYAKRGALCDALGIIVTGMDNDARMEGGSITPEQADELERRVKLTNSDVAGFLKFAGAKSFATIAANKYDMLDAQLMRKERGGK